MPYGVFHSQTLDKELRKYPADFLQWVEKMDDQLAENPYVGDPLRVPWFREKKKDKFRLYYLIYEEFKVVYIVGVSDKKDQQKIINTLWQLIDYLGEELKNLLRN